MTAFRRVADDPDPEAWVPVALPWVHDAGLPYVDWLFGGAEYARAELGRWMRRASSEVYVGRATLLLERERPVGGFIALSGAELAACRRADALAVASSASDRATVLERVRSSRVLFGDVSPDELYLSRLGVEADWRGRGFGGRLAGEYLASGAREGFRRFRLDVSADNEPATRLYRSLGFEVVSEASIPDGRIGYVAMALERGD